jgi:excisionase family DNA binding protein
MATTALVDSKLVTTRLQRQQAQELIGLAPQSDQWGLLGSGHVLGAVPPELSRLLTTILDTVANGGVITIGTMPDELTTTTAADLLGISRPTLMKFVSAGDLKAHRVGSHTRLKTSDVLEFRRARLDRQRRAFEELLALDVE